MQLPQDDLPEQGATLDDIEAGTELDEKHQV